MRVYACDTAAHIGVIVNRREAKAILWYNDDEMIDYDACIHIPGSVEVIWPTPAVGVAGAGLSDTTHRHTDAQMQDAQTRTQTDSQSKMRRPID